MEIYKSEKNENTALILMLGVLSDELKNISNLLNMLNNSSKQILSYIDNQKNVVKQEKRAFIVIDKEDYID